MLLFSASFSFRFRPLLVDFFLFLFFSSYSIILRQSLVSLYVKTVFFKSFVSVLRFLFSSVNFSLNSRAVSFYRRKLKRACVLLLSVRCHLLGMTYCLLQYSSEVLFPFPCSSILIFRKRVAPLGNNFN